VDNPEYKVFMDIQQSILLDIFKKFAAERISFAYPSQSLYIEKWPASSEVSRTEFS
jgi:small-conductance mechanosensitive channel